MQIKKCFVKVVGAIAATILLSVSVLAQAQATPTPPVEFEGISASTGLHYRTYGEGNPILAIHGLGASIYTWRKFIGAFSGYKLIVVDLRGAGDSPKPRDKRYSILDQADLIYQFIQEQNLTNLTLMGNSYGGAVSLLLAIRLTDDNSKRLSKLILIGSGGYKKHLPLHLKILRTPVVGWLAVHLLPTKCQARIVLEKSYYIDIKITKPQIAEYARPLGLPGGRHALLQTAKRAIPKDIDYYTNQYPKINVPTLLLWGVDDKLTPVKIGEMLYDAIETSRLQLINNCGHVPQEECPEKTICWISEFLGLPHGSCRKLTVR